jgi:hypothetical protein
MDSDSQWPKSASVPRRRSRGGSWPGALAISRSDYWDKDNVVSIKTMPQRRPRGVIRDDSVIGRTHSYTEGLSNQYARLAFGQLSVCLLKLGLYDGELWSP